MSEQSNKNYDSLLDIAKHRRTCRNFSDRPVLDEQVNMILEIARWAPSGANSQPWSYVVVRNPEIRKKLFEAYCSIDMDLMWWVEQMRCPEYRHNGYVVDCDSPEEGLRIKQTRRLWRDAPVIIAVVGDGRKQWGTVMGGHTMGLDQTHLTDGLSNTSLLIHLAAQSLGLTSQWMSIHTQGPFKEILGIPEPLMIHTLIPIGYPEIKLPLGGWRMPLEDLVHEDTYQMSKHITNQESVERIARLRKNTRGLYKPMVK
nr:nitroreductase family protein [uncultured Sphaerochaeta sp.]